MSGRLIITTKKSYCPWNAANVNRVLRDERLERERLKQQQRENEADSSRRRHRQGEEGHVNLFPEAAEAEIRLAQGTTTNNNNSDVEQNNNAGILPLPLGGEESTNRKNGKVPFYLQTNNQSEGKYYDNSSYLGIRTRTTTTSDEITNSIMRDQFASREEYRKQKNDPMSRFYVDSAHDVGNHYRLESHKESGNSLQDVKPNNDHGRNKSKKRKSRGGDDDRSETSSSSSSPSLSSSSTSSHDSKRRRRRKSQSRREERKRKRSKHSSSSNSRRHRSKSHPERSSKSKKKRHKDKRTRRRKHRYKDCSE